MEGKNNNFTSRKQITMPNFLNSNTMPSYWQERQTEWLKCINKTTQLDFSLTFLCADSTKL